VSLNHCEECQDRLPSLLEDQLEESEARMVRLHLDACPECQQEYEWLKTAFQDLEVLGDLYARRAPEVDLVDAVLRGAEEIDRGRFHPASERAPSPAVALGLRIPRRRRRGDGHRAARVRGPAALERDVRHSGAAASGESP
jgi:anti-sigma factor RsiW